MKILYELYEDDYDRRIELYKLIDEATFFLNGFVHKHNCRYCDNENLHLFREGHTQFPQKLNVWAGILGNEIIGPFFLEQNLTGQLYLNLLENEVNPRILQSLQDQQDRAPPHYTLAVKWIGRRGAIDWPARSLNLTPLDFFLWGYLKSKVYKTPIESIQELKNGITLECRGITRQTFINVHKEFDNRLYYCLENNGSHFEHLIK
ncbi:uncharacterized protein [Euwallacea similis]|uniref:uncharacterized protein n=1 Tax=Euwallacea similis TaxID=1736056 RepID=UPI00344FCBBD